MIRVYNLIQMAGKKYDKHVIDYIMFIMAIVLMNVCDTKTAKSRKSDETCDPVYDMLFVLDNSTNISQPEFQAQKQFVSSLIHKNKSPKGAARIAVLVCDVTGRVSTPFTDVINQPFENIDTKAAKQIDNASKTCLENINFKIKTESRASVTRIVVLLKGSWNWEDIRSQNEAALARQEGTVLVVIAIGVRDFDSLSSLQTIALREETFFVVSGYDKLDTLATSLARDVCKPISLDLTSEKKVTINTTKQPKIKRAPCKQVGPNDFQKYIPGFGYTRQRCGGNETLDIKSCSCL